MAEYLSIIYFQNRTQHRAQYKQLQDIILTENRSSFILVLIVIYEWTNQLIETDIENKNKKNRIKSNPKWIAAASHLQQVWKFPFKYSN